jgi:hypothetical protein
LKKQIALILLAAFLLVQAVYFFENNIFLPKAWAKVSETDFFVSRNDVADKVYDNINWCGDVPLSRTVFADAYKGFVQYKDKRLVSKNLLTIVDFGFSSSKKRLWVIDFNTNKLLYHTFVAHGKNSGEEYAKYFSNEVNSNKSSLGFFATAETYYGSNGLSLRLDGLEKGKNDQARVRAIVMHGAEYVSEKFIEQNGRLGRSQGCPAVPMQIVKELIQVLKNKSCLFIYHPDTETNGL